MKKFCFCRKLSVQEAFLDVTVSENRKIERFASFRKRKFVFFEKIAFLKNLDPKVPGYRFLNRIFQRE